MTVGRYELYGLRVSTEIPFAAAHLASGEECDLRVVLGSEIDVPDSIPDGHRMAELVYRDRRLYTATRHDRGYTFRFNSLCDFELSLGLDVIECRPSRGLSHELAAILVTGSIVSFILGLRGQLVLHGSAVRIGDHAVAFVAGSGMGKSTLAAQFCAGGAKLITDDVLVLSLDPPVEVIGRSTELRLREKAVVVVDDFATAPATRSTADERLAVRAAGVEEDRSRLAAIVCPRPLAAGEALHVERLGAVDALMELTAWPRVAKWCDPEQLARQFEGNAKVIESVPVHKAFIPWGPPFDADLPRQIRERLGL